MAYINNLSYEIGEERQTASLKEEGVSRESILQLLVRGADKYHRRKEPIFDVAVKAVSKVFKKTSVESDDVDILLIGTNSLAAEDFKNDFGHELLTKFNLKNAYVQLVGFQNCGDSVPILRTAKAMIQSGEAENVLIVIADDITAAGIPRILKDSYLHSDGAAACMVTKEGGGFKLGNSKVIHAKKASEKHDAYDIEGNLEFLLDEAVRIYSNDFASVKNPEFIVTHNMNQIFTRKVAEVFKVDIGMVYGLHSMGHCLAADVLINLNLLENKGSLKGGEQGVLVVPTSRSVGVYDICYLNNEINSSQVCV